MSNTCVSVQLGFNPKELLASILMVFINLGTNDKDGAFVGAVARDGRSYRPENFSEAVIVAKGVGLPDFTMAHIESLQLLSEQAAQAFAQQQIEDEVRTYLLLFFNTQKVLFWVGFSFYPCVSVCWLCSCSWCNLWGVAHAACESRLSHTVTVAACLSVSRRGMACVASV